MTSTFPTHRLYFTIATLLFASVASAELFNSTALTALKSEKQSELTNLLHGLRAHPSTPENAREKAAFLMKQLGLDRSKATTKASERGLSVKDQSQQLAAIGREISDEAEAGEVSLQAHLFDLALELNPDDLETAYGLEVLKVKKDAELEWLLETVADNYVADSIWTTVSLGSSNDPFVENLGDAIGRTQSFVVGLLVRQLGDSKYAGAASRMNATAVRDSKNQDWEILFNQRVGGMMTGALGRVESFLKKKHATVPQGFEVELSFEDQYIPKDGPSAAVACGLLLEALISNLEYDPGFAVTGDMTEEGVIGRVGGIDGKLRGAIAKKCTIVGIPAVNHYVVADLLLSEGPESISKVQIFQLEKFDQAHNLALKKGARPENLQTAIDQFAEVQAVVNRPGGMTYLKNPKVLEKLRNVVKLAPHHLSARYLYLRGINKDPAKLSLAGSLQAISRARSPLNRALRDRKFDPRASELNSDEFADTVSLLTRLRSKLDERTRKCADALADFAGLLREWRENRPNNPQNQMALIAKIEVAENRVAKEFDTLFSRPEVKEELELEDEFEDEDDEE